MSQSSYQLLPIIVYNHDQVSFSFTSHMPVHTGINVGFDPASYSVNEADRFAELTIVKFTNPPALTDNITVIFFTSDNTALG